jgi:hypothetical protein
MNRRAFFEAANDLSSWLKNLRLTTNATLLQAEDLLCREHRPSIAPSLKAEAALILAGIPEKIVEVMAAADRLAEAAGLPPRFELPLRLLESPDPTDFKLRELLGDP